MPEYLAPGVYVEETSYRSKSIEGVSTTTTGFIGPARYGPIDLDPEVITNLEQFELLYGDGAPLNWNGKKVQNFLWHGVRAFFAEGGQRMYIARVFKTKDGSSYPPSEFEPADPSLGETDTYTDGHARAGFPTYSLPDPGNAIQVRARFPGAAGNMRVRFTLSLSQNVLAGKPGKPIVNGLNENDIVVVGDISSPISSPPGTLALYRAESYLAAGDAASWRFINGPTTVTLDELTPDADPKVSDQIRIVTITVTVLPAGDGPTTVWANLAPASLHTTFGAHDSIFDQFAEKPATASDALYLPIIILCGENLTTGLDVLSALFAAADNLETAILDLTSGADERSYTIQLKGGNDGDRPQGGEYEGLQADPSSDRRLGFKLFENIDDISIVAAPGYSFEYETDPWRDQAAEIQNQLIIHATKMRYRIAILDCANHQKTSDVRTQRARLNTKYAALYYPWVRIMDPITRAETHLPPSGFVAGIYARNDITRAVYKAPANEVVNLAQGFETMLNKAQQDVLNPEGINCFRFFKGRGFLLWGARMATDDPEWKYVNLRRYFAYLEHSIDRGTQWAVFEPNGDPLWANVRRTIESFLYNEWVSGALLGVSPEKAYFVRCDRSTMTQSDLDNGRLICLIGVSVVRPAEYVIFRIGQWTADAK